MKSRDSQI